MVGIADKAQFSKQLIVLVRWFVFWYVGRLAALGCTNANAPMHTVSWLWKTIHMCVCVRGLEIVLVELV